MLWLRIASGLAVVLTAISFGVRLLESALTFHPALYEASSPAWSPPSNAQELWIANPRGGRLHSWRFRPAGGSRGVILYSHGNGGSVAGMRDFAGLITARGYEVVVWDYPGYGRSDGPLAVREEDLFTAASAVYDAQSGGGPVNVWGQSLGSTVSADLCSRRPCRSLVMESALSSAAHYAETRVPWVPSILRVFARNSFASAEKLGRVRCPTLIAHGLSDANMDYSHARILYQHAAGSPKQLLMVPHGTHWLPASPGYLDRVARFLDEPTHLVTR